MSIGTGEEEKGDVGGCGGSVKLTRGERGRCAFSLLRLRFLPRKAEVSAANASFACGLRPKLPLRLVRMCFKVQHLYCSPLPSMAGLGDFQSDCADNISLSLKMSPLSVKSRIFVGKTMEVFRKTLLPQYDVRDRILYNPVPRHAREKIAVVCRTWKCGEVGLVGIGG